MVVLVDARPSAETGKADFQEHVDISSNHQQPQDHEATNKRQPTPDLVPQKHHLITAVTDDTSASTTLQSNNSSSYNSSFDSTNSELGSSEVHNNHSNNEVQAPDNGDVSAVVDKAKRAAQSLWILVHAQNCRLGADRCPHKGCMEAKRVFLHLKICPASTATIGGPCPTGFHGCHQSRKLITHYQKCREVRAKQAGMGRRANTVHHVCLVCSLVARHAKSVLEGSTRKSTSKKQVIASFTLSEPAPDVGVARRNSKVTMPPPPPRQPGGGSILQTWPTNPIGLQSYPSSNSDDWITSGYEDNPRTSTNQLMLFSQVVAAAAVAIPPAYHYEEEEEEPTHSYSAALGKSVDSGKHQFLTSAASALQNLKRAPTTSSVIEPLPSSHVLTSPRRSRAESYDERALKQFQNNNNDNNIYHHHASSSLSRGYDSYGNPNYDYHQYSNRRPHQQHHHHHHSPSLDHDGNRMDPTWEFDLKNEQSQVDMMKDAPSADTAFFSINRRSRSASLGMLASACLERNGCDTIAEEDNVVMHQQQQEGIQSGGGRKQDDDDEGLPFNMDDEYCF